MLAHVRCLGGNERSFHLEGHVSWAKQLANILERLMYAESSRGRQGRTGCTSCFQTARKGQQ